MAASAPARCSQGNSPWLYGPAVDLLIGCGGAYLLSVPVLVAIGHATGSLGWSATVATLLALLVSGPHYGATLLRVYREGADRLRYRLFAVHATLVLVAVYVLALHNAALGSWLLTLYVSLAVWHFASQNYGIALMMVRRRGVAISDTTKHWFHRSFMTSFALSFLLIHMEGSRYVLAIGADDPEGYGILRLGIPFASVAPIAVALGVLHVFCLGAAARGARRGGASLPDLWPALLIVVTQSVWYTIPGLLLAIDGLALDLLPFTAVWLSVAHAGQYLWVTSYYAKRAAGADSPARHLSRALMAGALVLTVPALIFAPALLGGVPWDGGLAVMTFSALNLHHFLLDGAVWKLRDGRVARALLHGVAREGAAGTARMRRMSGAPLFAIGAPFLALALFAIWEGDVARSADPDRARAALDRLRWLGRDSASLRFAEANRYAERGDVETAISQYERSIAVQPTANAWAALSVAYDRYRRWDAARSAGDEALALDPGHTVGLIHNADLALRRAADLAPAEAARERELAATLIERALASHDAEQSARVRLAGLAGGLEQAGRADDARWVRRAIGAPDSDQSAGKSEASVTDSQSSSEALTSASFAR